MKVARSLKVLLPAGKTEHGRRDRVCAGDRGEEVVVDLLLDPGSFDRVQLRSAEPERARVGDAVGVAGDGELRGDLEDLRERRNVVARLAQNTQTALRTRSLSRDRAQEAAAAVNGVARDLAGSRGY